MKVFAVRIELDATPSNGVDVVFGRDADGDGILSRTEEAMEMRSDSARGVFRGQHSAFHLRQVNMIH